MSSAIAGTVARATLAAAVTIDRARIRWRQGIRTGVVVTLVVAAGLVWSTTSAAVAMALGAAFIGIADTPDPDRNRLTNLALTLLALMAGVAVGGLIADSIALRVIVSAAVAAVCGFVGTIGPRTALAGVMTLVLVTIYAGTPGPLEAGIESAGWLAVGGVAYLCAILPDWPLRTLVGLRTTIAAAYRGIGLAAARPDHSISVTGLALLPTAAHSLVESGDTRGTTRAWADHLITAAEESRRGLIALHTESAPAADALRTQASKVLLAIARALDAPWRRGRVAQARRDMDTAVQRALDAGVPTPLVSGVREPVDRAADLITTDWPVRSRAQTGTAAPLFSTPVKRLRQSLTTSDLFARHAIRLAAAIAVATIIGELLRSEPGYWIPLTVAWIAKPDLAGTVSRVVMRLGGTLVGVVIATLATYLFTGEIIHAIGIGIGALVVSAFLLASYSIAVVGITAFVILLLALAGEPVRTLSSWRMLDTLIAGVIVLGAALILPHATGSSVHRDLAELARCGARYSDAVLTGEADAMTAPRQAVLTARVRAESAAAAACQEPVAHQLNPVVALAIMSDLRLVSAQLLRWHELAGTQEPPPRLASLAHDGLMSLARCLDVPDQSAAQWRVPDDASAAEHDLLDPIASAHARLSGDRVTPPGTAAQN